MQLLPCYKIVTGILGLVLPLLISVNHSQAADHSIHIEWTYQAPQGEAIQLFSLYMEDSVVCQTTTPADREMDCEFEAPNGTFNFYLSARTDKGESPLSPPFPFTLNEIIKTYTLDISLAGNEAGTVTSTLAEFDNCTTDCSVNALQDSLVTLTPIANEGYKFTGWYGDQCTGSAPCTIRMDQHYSIEAKFEKKFPWDLFMPVLLR